MFNQGFTVDLCTLSLLKAQETAVVRRIKSTDQKICETLKSMGIFPGLSITLEKRFPDWIIRVGETRVAINSQIASYIYVKKEV